MADRHTNETSPIQRKPLPNVPFANYPASQRPPTPPKSYPHYQPPLPGSETATQVERYTARGANLRLNTIDTSSHLLGSRKPVGARPMPVGSNLGFPTLNANHETGASPSPIDQAQKQFKLARKPVQSTLSARAHDPTKIDVDQNSPTRTTIDLVTQLRTTFNPHDAIEPLRVTLIRRDPASGSQWNVGSIMPQKAAGHLHEVNIELTSPGYSSFAKVDCADQGGFRRRVAFLPTSVADGASITRKRSNSAESFSNSIGLNRGRSRQAYAFVSPWQGMCAFSNGIDGKSLRCRQFLPGANPSMPGVTLDVAELRFNLPWATLRLKEPGRRQGNELSEVSPNRAMARTEGSSNREQWRRSIQVLTHKAKKQLSMSDSIGDWTSPEETTAQRDRDTEESHMSLDLGREKAGGGFEGHSAKLGKLIIHDEGLKMCDLVVAACMGVWWQQYAENM